MAFKHQSGSFRNLKGEHYVCWTDELSPDHRHGAKIVVEEMRKKNVRSFAVHANDEGYSRVFIHEADAVTAGLLVSHEEIATNLKVRGRDI